jgi:hypothetical protein
MPTTTEKLFNNATALVHERGIVYGHAIYNMERIAKSVSAYIDFPIMPHDIPIINVLQKISIWLKVLDTRTVSWTSVHTWQSTSYALKPRKTESLNGGLENNGI